MVRTARKKIMPNTPFLRCHRAAHRSRITANMCRYITHDHPLLIMGSSVLTFPSPALAGEAGGMLRPLAGFWFLNGQGVGGKHHGTGRFPSPCGVLVLKFLRNDTNPCRAGDVSVPLWGSPILASPVATGEVASNASRWGCLWLACTSDAMKVYSLRPWRPPSTAYAVPLLTCPRSKPLGAADWVTGRMGKRPKNTSVSEV